MKIIISDNQSKNVPFYELVFPAVLQPLNAKS